MSGLILLGGVRAFDYYRDQATPDDIGRTYTITIRAADDADEVAETLADAGLIQNDLYFKTLEEFCIIFSMQLKLSKALHFQKGSHLICIFIHNKHDIKVVPPCLVS